MIPLVPFVTGEPQHS